MGAACKRLCVGTNHGLTDFKHPSSQADTNNFPGRMFFDVRIFDGDKSCGLRLDWGRQNSNQDFSFELLGFPSRKGLGPRVDPILRTAA